MPETNRQTINGIRAAAFCIMLSALTLLLLGSCSTVFTASISGSAIDKESWEEDEQELGIGDVEVFLYNDEKDWAADYSRWTEEGLRPDTVEEDEDPNFFLSTVSGADGAFTFSGLIWNRFFPTYGKSGDRVEVYFLFYNRDYGISKNPTPVYIVSDVTNQLTPFKLERVTNPATIEGMVVNSNTGEGVGAVNLSFYVASSLEPAVYPEDPDYQSTTAPDGTYSQSFSFPKALGDSGKVKITAERNGFNCENYDGDGTPAGDYLETGLIEKDSTYTAAEIEIKQTEFNETLEGKVFNDDGDDIYEEGTDTYVNGVTLWFFLEDPNSLSTTDSPNKRASSQSRIVSDTVEQGYFIFNNINWTDETYTGENSTLTVYLYRPTPAEISDNDLDPPLVADDINKFTMVSNEANYIEIPND